MKSVEMTRSAAGVALGGAVVALVMSGWALVLSLDEDEEQYRQAIEQRLVCLEQPGPNDCGVDADR